KPGHTDDLWRGEQAHRAPRRRAPGEPSARASRDPRGTGTRVRVRRPALGRYRAIAARAMAAAMVRIANDAARRVHVYESDRIRALVGTRS
ncbi:MAG: hypothetical protein ACREX4_24800, partial [Gammaproteobacteria bacterium]